MRTGARITVIGIIGLGLTAFTIILFFTYQLLLDTSVTAHYITDAFGVSIKDTQKLINFLQINYKLLISCGVTMALLIFLLNLYLLKKYTSFVDKTQHIYSRCGTIIQKAIGSYDLTMRMIVVGVFIVIIVSRLFIFSRSVVIFDEAMSYTWFTGKGLLYTISNYQVPNNHIFYNVICVAFDTVFNDPAYILKLPTLLISIISFPIFIIIFTRYFKPKYALLYTCLIQGAYFFNYYSVNGRGYILLIFFSVLLLDSAIKWIHFEKNYSKSFVVFAALGLWTIPTFVYPLLAVSLVIFLFVLRSEQQLKGFLLVHFTLLALVLLLYGPILLVTGTHDLLGNRFVQSLSWSDMLARFPEKFLLVQNYLTGWSLSWILELGIIIYLYWKYRSIPNYDKIKILFAFLIALEVVPVIMMILQQVTPYSRVWSFQIVSKFGLVILFIREIWNGHSLSIYLKYALIFLFIGFQYFKVINKIEQTKIRYKDELAITDLVLEQNIDSVYAKNYYLYTLLKLNQMAQNTPRYLTHVPEKGLNLYVIDINHPIDSNLYMNYERQNLYRTEVYLQKPEK